MKEYSLKQKEILEKATELFSQKGYTGVSVRDIAQKASCNISMISYYFGSKEGLFESIFQMHAQEVQKQFMSLELFEGSLEEGISYFIDNMFLLYQEKESFLKIMISQVLFGENPKLQENAQKIISQNLKMLHSFIKKHHINIDEKEMPLYGMTLMSMIIFPQLASPLFPFQNIPQEKLKKFIMKLLMNHLQGGAL